MVLIRPVRRGKDAGEDVDMAKEDASCPHHWLIGDILPGQDKNVGTCRLCNATKQFPSVFLDVRYNNPRAEQRAGAGPSKAREFDEDYSYAG